MQSQTVVLPGQAVQTAQQAGQQAGAQVQILVPGAEAPGPSEVYEAFRAQRRELANQLESLEESRNELSQQLQVPLVEGANKAGLERRITDIDQRIADVEKAIAASNAEVARAAAVPGAVVEEPPFVRDGPPEEVFVLGGMFMVVVLFPIAIAYARRLWKRAGTAVMTLPAELYERMTRLEQSVDSIAVEVERIGEGQRFMTKVLSDHREPLHVPLGAGESARR